MAFRREWRHVELIQLQHTNPERIFELYGQLPAHLQVSRRPTEVSFNRMIEAILDHEEARDKLTDKPPT
jgi:hypothetical protein